MSTLCADCGFVFEKEDYNKPCCPKCGSRNRHIIETDEGKGYELLKLREDGNALRKHNHRFCKETMTGERIGTDDKLVSIKQVVDRERDTYTKTIKDEHGRIIVQKDEKLSEHR